MADQMFVEMQDPEGRKNSQSWLHESTGPRNPVVVLMHQDSIQQSDNILSDCLFRSTFAVGSCFIPYRLLTSTFSPSFPSSSCFALPFA